MVRVLHSLLTDILPAEQTLSFFPYLHFPPSDEWDHKSRLQSSALPSTDSSHLGRWVQSQLSTGFHFDDTSGPNLTIQSGDFLSVYSPSARVAPERTGSDASEDEGSKKILSGHRESSFDGIVTSFFLDTGSDLLEYLITIHHLLRPGGVWVNTGPLHYHSVTATPYSWRLVREVIQALGFVSLESTVIESSYCGEEAVLMKPEHYRYPLEVWRLDKQPPGQEETEAKAKEEAIVTTNFIVSLLGRK
jgi:hypothetical protein